jgi:hypothetical protein
LSGSATSATLKHMRGREDLEEPWDEGGEEEGESPSNPVVELRRRRRTGT